jgi:soluble lytic murein transglycosylase-like protein
MQINLKTTILLSTALAVVLNVGEFLVSPKQGQTSFFDGWAVAGTTVTPAPVATPQKLSALPPIVATTPGSAASNAAPTADSAAIAAKLTQAGLKPEFAPLYLKVQKATGTPWQLLAAVHRVETGQRGNTTIASYAGAQGPMQFMPATWRAYGMDGDGNGTKDIYDVDDAMMGAGRYLAANGANKGNYSNALWHYNHSWSYVSTVTAIAKKLGL